MDSDPLARLWQTLDGLNGSFMREGPPHLVDAYNDNILSSEEILRLPWRPENYEVTLIERPRGHILDEAHFRRESIDLVLAGNYNVLSRRREMPGRILSADLGPGDLFVNDLSAIIEYGAFLEQTMLLHIERRDLPPSTLYVPRRVAFTKTGSESVILGARH